MLISIWWSTTQVFHKRMPPEAVDLVSRLLQYSPNLRCNAVCFLSWLFLTLFTVPVDGKWISLVRKGALLSYQADQLEIDWYCNSRIVASLYCSPLVLTGANFLLILFGCMQLEACVHPFFDELRDPNCRLPNGRPLPPLFNFKPQGSVLSISSLLWLMHIWFRWPSLVPYADDWDDSGWNGQNWKGQHQIFCSA